MAGPQLGPVEQLGCARRPVKAEVAGSNPVGTAWAPLREEPVRGQVAQSVERAAENRKVGGSIPSLPTTTTGQRYDGAQTIAAFSARLRQQVDLDTLSAELRGVVEQTVQPTRVSLWLRR